MSEICPDCLNRLTGRRDARWVYVVSKEPELCEACGQYVPVVVVARWVKWRRYLLPAALLLAAAWFFHVMHRWEHLDGADNL